jgi:hypothetical protein
LSMGFAPIACKQLAPDRRFQLSRMALPGGEPQTEALRCE